MKLRIIPTKPVITLADVDSHSKLYGTCKVDINLNETFYRDVELGVFSGLCTDILLGGDFLQQHNQVIFRFDSDGSDLVIDKSNIALVPCH